MNKRIIKELSGMSIDEVSLVDRGANQHALISFAKRADGVDALFDKARGGHTDTGKTGESDAKPQTYSGNDPAGVVDEYADKESGSRDTGAPAGKTISGTQKVKGEDITGVAGKAKTKSVKGVSSSSSGTDDEDVESSSGGGLKTGLGAKFAEGVKKSDESLDVDDDYVLAKALGLIVDGWDDEVEKGFGPPQPSPFQQNAGAPGQFGQPPAMQSVGAQPMGMGAPQAPPAMPGMHGGQPQMPGAGAIPGQVPGMGGPVAGGMPVMGQPQMPGQGAPAQLGMAQLPPEAIAYIQQLEAQLAQLQGNDNGGESDSKPESSDSSSGDSNSDNSNKPFGKSGDFDVNQDTFLEELSKAIRDEDRGEFSKALQARFAEYEGEISKAQEIAKAERDLRLEREFIAKAEEFDVPVAPTELGPVLKRLAENVSEEDFSVIVKCLDAATETNAALYGEIGKRGGGANSDIFAAVEAEAQELAKSAGVSPAEGVAAVFEANPAAYDEYLANRRGR